MKKPVNLRLDADLWVRFRVRAIQEGTTGSAIVERFRERYLGAPTHGQTDSRAALGKKENCGKARDTRSCEWGRKGR